MNAWGMYQLVRWRSSTAHAALAPGSEAHSFARCGAWVSALTRLAAIPNPTFDVAGIAAGALRFPLSRFVLACGLGKILKNVAVAFVGAESLDLFGRLLPPY